MAFNAVKVSIWDCNILIFSVWFLLIFFFFLKLSVKWWKISSYEYSFKNKFIPVLLMNLLCLFSYGPTAEFYKNEYVNSFCLCKDNFEVTCLNTHWCYTLNLKAKKGVLDQSSKLGTETKPWACWEQPTQRGKKT